MHKEVIIAIILGSLLGVIVAFGVWRANSAIKNKGEIVTTDSQKDNEDNIPTISANEISLSLQKPNNKQSFGVTTVEFMGITNQGGLVAISSEDEDRVIMADDTGEFGGEIELNGGVNDIFFYAFNENGFMGDSRVLLYSSSLNDNETTSVEDEVEARVENASNPLTSTFGTITDLTEEVIEIQTDNGIGQVVVSEKTSYANVVNTSKEIEFSDLAIGDYAIVMGRESSDETIEALRILVSEKYLQTNRKAVVGVVDEINSTSLTLTDTNSNVLEISLSRAVDYYSKNNNEVDEISRSEIEEESRIFVIYIEGEKGNSARMIYVFDNN